MKNVHIIAILGGAATLAYFATRGGKAQAARRIAPTATDRFGAPITHEPEFRFRASAPGVAGGCINRSGALVDMKFCTGAGNNADAMLEGYFSTGDSSPCCDGCAHGRGCRG